MTRTEFLLARIAERESAARDMQHQEQTGRPLLRLLGGGTGIRDLVDPARVLARCEADRRIVEEYVDICKWDTDAADDHGIHGQRMGLEFAVKSLAAVYADHPDCREEWKP